MHHRARRDRRLVAARLALPQPPAWQLERRIVSACRATEAVRPATRCEVGDAGLLVREHPVEVGDAARVGRAWHALTLPSAQVGVNRISRSHRQMSSSSCHPWVAAGRRQGRARGPGWMRCRPAGRSGGKGPGRARGGHLPEQQQAEHRGDRDEQSTRRAPAKPRHDRYSTVAIGNRTGVCRARSWSATLPLWRRGPR